MKKLESAYNHHLIFPLLRATVKSIPSIDFEVGEIKLRAMTRELKFFKEDTSNFYNADGLYSTSISNFTYELALLETTGPFEKYNWHKETQDFVKAGYGLVAMLHTLGRNIFYGNKEIFKKINVFFLQATPTKLRVWKMALADKEVYLLEKCSGVDLQNYESREILHRNLINMFWRLKIDLEDNVGRVQELAQSHQENVKKAVREKVAMEKLPTLFKKNANVKLPDIYLRQAKNDINTATNVTLWRLWKTVLYRIKNDTSLDEYNLHNLHIVQLGGKTKSATTTRYYPPNLIKQTTSKKDDTEDDYFEKEKDEYNALFDIIEKGSFNEVEEYLAEKTLMVYKKNDNFIKFVFKVAEIMNDAYFQKQKQMKKLESAYNPLLKPTIKSVPSIDFEVGETKLRAITRELKFYEEDTSNFYNADGLYCSSIDDFTYELALLETTGPFEKPNWHKETQDQVKAGYGLVAMLHTLGRKFFLGDKEIFKRINVFFLQATPTKFRVWKMALVDKEVYLLEKCSGVNLQEYESREILLRNLITMLWNLKSELEKNVGRVEELAQSHQENLKKVVREKDDMERLPALFKKNANIKLPDKYLRQAKVMRMNSSSSSSENDE